MNSNILEYLLESGSCLAAFYFLYLVALKKETSFQYNRFYLLAASLLSFLLPLLKLPLLPYQPIATFRPITLQLEPIVVYATTGGTIDANSGINSNSSIGGPELLLMVYVLGVCFFTFRLLRQLYAIYQFVYHRKNEVVRWNGIKLIQTNGQFATFSFVNYIFWDNSQQLTKPEREQVLQHESVHVWQGHSYDMLYLEMLQIIFWFNPLLLLYKKALLSTHEFIADSQVLQTTDKQEYARLLAKQVCLKMEFSIGNYFNKSLTLKRMKMIQTTNHHTPMLKKIMALPLLTGLLFLFSSNTSPVSELNANATRNMKSPVAAMRAETVKEAATQFQLEITSNKKMSFIANWYYIDKNGKRIDKSEKLATPYIVTIEALEFRGIFERDSKSSDLQIKVKDKTGQMVSNWRKTVIEIEQGSMNTWGIN